MLLIMSRALDSVPKSQVAKVLVAASEWLVLSFFPCIPPTLISATSFKTLLESHQHYCSGVRAYSHTDTPPGATPKPKVFRDDPLGILGPLLGRLEGFEDSLMDLLWGEVVALSPEFLKVGKELEEI
ncbi:hypothetical protein QC764_0049450 [Podospora pseudoanserina]|uniref:Uncharacterized protein n=1 Tax=Podospora pseudoanserina TaxID=2609844 RepID=A0ABR0IBU7_9PEZI|nr:hypothetical protein QC764_0049450 [Podospora pseudoanserina]